MKRMNRKRLGLLALLAALACGCTETSSVSGTVTYEGNPIENGQVLFLPADGKGPSAGGTIVNGQYTIKSLAPGAKIVQIVPAPKIVTPVVNLDDVVKKGPQGAGPVEPPTSSVPADAEGNNVRVEVKPGKQVLDFNLKKKENPSP